MFVVALFVVWMFVVYCFIRFDEIIVDFGVLLL